MTRPTKKQIRAALDWLETTTKEENDMSNNNANNVVPTIKLVPAMTIEEAVDPDHPWYGIVIPWGVGGHGEIESWTYRGKVLPDSKVVATQHSCSDAGRPMTAAQVVKELVENDGIIPLRSRHIDDLISDPNHPEWDGITQAYNDAWPRDNG